MPDLDSTRFQILGDFGEVACRQGEGFAGLPVGRFVTQALCAFGLPTVVAGIIHAWETAGFGAGSPLRPNPASEA